MTPEAKVKKKVVDILKKHGAYYFFPVASGYARAGIPDIIVCIGGRFIAIECKAGNGKTTALQDKEIEKIHAAGGVAFVVNETNIDLVDSLLSGGYKAFF